MGVFGGIGSTDYPDGRFPPERGGSHNWNVWCPQGAAEVLRSREHEEWLRSHPGESYTINFANNASTRYARPDHPLWRELRRTAAGYDVEVFPLALGGKYRPWTGAEGDVTGFDAIKISAKSPTDAD